MHKNNFAMQLILKKEPSAAEQVKLFVLNLTSSIFKLIFLIEN